MPHQPSSSAPGASPTPHRTIYVVLGAVLVVCLGLRLAVPLATLPLHVSWDYGEGWNAYWAVRAITGASLYTDRLATITNNYPPLSFYIFGAVGRLGGDQIIAGRLLSLAALAACAAMVGALAARLGADRRWAVASGLGFLLYIGVFAWKYIASNDPQWVAACFTLAALLIVVRPGSAWPSARRLVTASALLVIGGLIKHNQLAAPLAITLWLAMPPRRGLVAWLASSAVFCLVALGAIYALFGSLAFDQIVHHQRVFKAHYFFSAVRALSGMFPEMALAGLMWTNRRREAPEPGLALLLLFAAVALVLGVLERFGTGVAVNAHFDTAIGFFVVGGIALGRADLLQPAARLAMSVVALAPLLVGTLVMLPREVRRLATLPETAARWNTSLALIRNAPGPAACELPAMCFWAGRPFLLDFYNYGQKLRKSGDPAGLMGMIVRREFAVMVVVRDRRFRHGDGRLPGAYDKAIAANYRVVGSLPEHVFLLTPVSPGAS